MAGSYPMVCIPGAREAPHSAHRRHEYLQENCFHPGVTAGKRKSAMPIELDGVVAESQTQKCSPPHWRDIRYGIHLPDHLFLKAQLSMCKQIILCFSGMQETSSKDEGRSEESLSEALGVLHRDSPNVAI